MTKEERHRKDVLTLALFNTVRDLVSNFLYYDRKEDEVLDREAIAEMFQKGWTNCDEVEGWFAEALEEGAPKRATPEPSKAEDT